MLGNGELAPLVGLRPEPASLLEQGESRQVWRTALGPAATLEFVPAPPPPPFEEIARMMRASAVAGRQGVIELRPFEVAGSPAGFYSLFKQFVGDQAQAAGRPFFRYAGTIFLPCSDGAFSLSYQARESSITGIREATVAAALGLNSRSVEEWFVDVEEYAAVGLSARSVSDDPRYDLPGHPLTVIRAQVAEWQTELSIDERLR